MKVLFSLTFYSPYVSGLTIYVKRLAGELVRKGYQCEVLAFSHESGLASKEKINGVSVNRVKPWLRISKGFVSPEWVTRALATIKETDVVIINLPQAEGWICALIAKVLKKPVVAIYHCEIVLPNKFIQIILEWFNKLTLLLADRIITYTEDYGNNSLILRPFKSKLNFVYPPIPIQKTDLRWRKLLNKKIGMRKTIVGVAARLAKEKGLEYLFEAIPLLKKRLGKVKIVVAGPTDPIGEAGYKSEIIQKVKMYKDDIIFLGTVPEEKMGSFYSLLDVLVLPSVNSTESFGMVQAEAMELGVPVVSTNLPGVRVPVRVTGMGKVVNPRSGQEIAQAIEELIKNRQRLTKLKTKSQKEFRLNKTTIFYDKLINNLSRRNEKQSGSFGNSV